MNEPPWEVSRGVRLRPWERPDRDAFLALFADPLVMQYVGDGEVDLEADRELFEKIGELDISPQRRFAFVCAVVVDGTVGGHFELKTTEDCLVGEWEIVYVLAQSFWGQGIATRLVSWGLEAAHHHDKRVVATVDPRNAASIHILEKLGVGTDGGCSGETTVLRERFPIPASSADQSGPIRSVRNALQEVVGDWSAPGEGHPRGEGASSRRDGAFAPEVSLNVRQGEIVLVEKEEPDRLWVQNETGQRGWISATAIVDRRTETDRWR